MKKVTTQPKQAPTATPKKKLISKLENRKKFLTNKRAAEESAWVRSDLKVAEEISLTDLQLEGLKK